MTRRISAITLLLAFILGNLCVTAHAAPLGRAQGAGGQIAGIAQDAGRRPLANVIVRIRNRDTGMTAAEVKSAADGAYLAGGLAPAAYVVEVVDQSGRVIGVSGSVTVAPGAAISGVIVTTTAAGVAAAGAATGGTLAFFGSAAGIATVAASVATVVVVANRVNGSPSR